MTALQKELLILIREILGLPNDYSDIDFAKLVNISLENRIPGLCASIIKKSQGATLWAENWSYVYSDLCLERYELQRKECLTLIDQLSKMNIECIIFKGCDISLRLHEDVSERFSSDIDIMVEAKDLLLAKKCIIEQGYKVNNKFNLSKDALEDYTKTQIKYHHDPINLCKIDDNYSFMSNKHFYIDLHQNKNFDGIEIKPFFISAIKNIKDGYATLTDIDLIVITGWHLYHHLIEQIPEEKPFKRYNNLKLISDFFKAIEKFIKCGQITVDDFISRVKQTNSEFVIEYSLKRLIGIFKYIKEAPPEYLVNLYVDLKNMLRCNTYRIFYEEYKFGESSINFWEYILENEESMKRILDNISMAKRMGYYTKVMKSKKVCMSINDSGENDRLIYQIHRDSGMSKTVPTIKVELTNDTIEVLVDYEHDLQYDIYIGSSTNEFKVIRINSVHNPKIFLKVNGVFRELGNYIERRVINDKMTINRIELPSAMAEYFKLSKIYFGFNAKTLPGTKEKISMRWPSSSVQFGEIILNQIQ